MKTYYYCHHPGATWREPTPMVAHGQDYLYCPDCKRLEPVTRIEPRPFPWLLLILVTLAAMLGLLAIALAWGA